MNYEKEKIMLSNISAQFDVIEKALLKAKAEGKKTINLKEELENFPAVEDYETRKELEEERSEARAQLEIDRQNENE